jgi:hypothetical protein
MAELELGSGSGVLLRTKQPSLAMASDNPKVDPPPLSNTEKDPDDWNAEHKSR